MKRDELADIFAGCFEGLQQRIRQATASKFVRRSTSLAASQIWKVGERHITVSFIGPGRSRA
jgi:hypothetical protein